MRTTYKLFKNNKLTEKIFSFREIKSMMDRNLFKIPECQTSLDENKINDMVTLYQKNPCFLRFKNKVVIGNLNNNLYVIDGQHRIHTANILSY